MQDFDLLVPHRKDIAVNTDTVLLDTVQSDAATRFGEAARYAKLALEALAGVNFDTLTPAQRIGAALVAQGQTRFAQAVEIRVLSSLARQRSREPERQRGSTETEVGVALAWPPATVQTRLAEAAVLTDLFSDALSELERGRIAYDQIRALVQLTRGLSDETARAVQAATLATMPGKLTATTRKALIRAIDRAEPEAAEQRSAYERTRRKITLRPEPYGMCTLTLFIPAEQGRAVMDFATRQAKKREKGDERLQDQRQVDAVIAKLLAQGGVPKNRTQVPDIPALVHVVVPINTLLREGSEPGELKGLGPICAEQARRIAFAEGSRWRWLLVSSDGVLAAVSPHTYTPGRALSRYVELRNLTCVFPDCEMPSDACDIDHGLQFLKGGLTVEGNLGPICRTHHGLKGAGEWQLERVGDYFCWTAPSGRSYVTEPTRYPVG
jgi:hypothetical protein